jgi:hypothetical protein
MTCNILLTLFRNDGNSVLITGFTDYYVTGGTYSNGTLTLDRQNGFVTITGLTTTFTGNTSGDCITDLFVTNVNSCSPLHIQPNNLGDVYIGENGGVNVGIGTTFPSEKLEVSGKTKTTNFQMTNNANNGYILTSDGSGNASWNPLTSVSGYSDNYVTGFTFNTGTYDLTILQNNGLPSLTQNLGILAGDITVTGGTYNPNDGVATFYNNIGGSFQVSGFLTGFTDIYLTSGSFNPNNGDLTLTRTDNVNVVVTGVTDYYVTGGTYSNGTLTLERQNGSVVVTGITNNNGGGGGGGSSGSLFYFNLSVPQSPYREISETPVTAIEQTSGVTIGAGLTSTISSFLTPSGSPNITNIPAGIWSFFLHSYKQNNNASFNIFCEVYVRTTGGTETLLISSDPEPITSNSPNPSMQVSDVFYSGTSLNSSDRILVKVRSTNTSNQSHVVTFVTEGTRHYSYLKTSFGGLSTITLQQAYNNSVNPEITTNVTLGGVQFKGGTGVDTDKNIIIENNAGNQTAWIQADGESSFNSVLTNSLSANTITLTTIPTINNSNTEILSRNSSTGNIETTTVSSLMTTGKILGLTQIMYTI